MGLESDFKLITERFRNGEVCLNHYEGEYKEKKLILPEGIHILGSECLTNLDIEELTLPESLEIIYKRCFKGCKKLRIINFGSKLSYVHNDSFNGIRNLEKINGNSYSYKSIDGFLCDEDYSLVFCPKGKIKGDVVLPEGIKILSASYRPFYGRNNITSLTLPQSLKRIDNESLVGLRNVHDLHFTKNIELIDSDIFLKNKYITSYSIDSENPYYINEDDYLYSVINHELVFVNEASTSSFTLPKDCKHIRGDAFENCNFTSITIPSVIDLNAINDDKRSIISSPLFNNCKNLKELHIENKKTIIKEEWFTDRHYFHNIKYSKEVYNVFRHFLRFFYPSQLAWDTKMELLKDIIELFQTKDSNVSLEWKKAWSDFFKRNRKRFFSLILEDEEVFDFFTENNYLSVGNIQDLISLANDMEDCELTNELLEYENTHFTMEERIKESNKMFKIENPNTVTYLKKIFRWEKNEDNTITILSYKGNEKEVFVPETIGGAKVTKIGNRAFSPSQDRIKYEQSNNRELIEKIFLPPTITFLGFCAFAYCKSLKEINLPEGLAVVSDRVFDGCDSLTSITIPSTVKKISFYQFMDFKKIIKEICFLNKDTEIIYEQYPYPDPSSGPFLPTIKGIIGGKVEEFAKVNKINFVPLEENTKQKDC